VIDTTDTVLYPAHLIIGAWRMFFAVVLLAVCGVCYGLWWGFENIYHHGVMSTAVDISLYVAGLKKIFRMPPLSLWWLLASHCVWCCCRSSAGSRNSSWRFGGAVLSCVLRAPDITAAEIITRGYDPDDFDLEQIDGVVYGKRRGA
jgi:hypothetical protein